MLQVTTSPIAWAAALLNFSAVATTIVISARLVFLRKEKAWIPICLAVMLAYGLSYISIARIGRIPAVPYERVEIVQSSTGPMPSTTVHYSLDILALGIACGALIASRKK